MDSTLVSDYQYDLDRIVSSIVAVGRRWASPDYPLRAQAVEETLGCPNRFSLEAITFALNQQFSLLDEHRLRTWLGRRQAETPLAVGVLNAGNVPLAGLQDLLAVLMCGHSYFGTVSSKSPMLLPAFVDDLVSEYDGVTAVFAPVEDVVEAVDAIIAAGSDGTIDWVLESCRAAGIHSRNQLLRGHTYSVGVVGRDEPARVWSGLAEDILLHEGLGCRNVSILWAPRDSSPDELLSEMARFRAVFPGHSRTIASLKMPIAFASASGNPSAHADDGSFLVTKGPAEPQQPGHLRWVEYDKIAEVELALDRIIDRIQVLVCPEYIALRTSRSPLTIRPGFAQRPSLDWQPSGRDTMDFLCNLESDASEDDTDSV